MTGPTRQIAGWIESIDPGVVDGDSRAVVSGLVTRTLIAIAATTARSRSDPASAPLGVDLLTDASVLAAGLRAGSFSEHHADLVDLAAPVVGASLAIAIPRPCSGARLGAAILAGCELGLLIREMVGSACGPRLRAAAATCAAISAARVVDLRGDLLLSAIGIGASSSVGAAVALETAWQAGKSASNGVLAALLAEAGLTGPADAIEHPRGLLGAVFDLPPAARTAGGLGSRIGLMKPMVSPATPTDGLAEKAAGMWEMERASELVAAVLPDRTRR
ncbi:MAG: MmgE/PrpD family protein [bacterium]|nr:MmgE/PrpD family protein [bacterium]MDE0287946.1 MmgE/PrpD family protein [bacterium]MDE0436979.1 MmgE/PrpD family protein [bacterium]